MGFEVLFLRVFADSLWFMAPTLGVLLLVIVGLGLWVGKQEGWSTADSVYYAFITATTVGYGDFHPSQGPAKFAAVVIALVGMLLTGIVVALALNAATVAFKATHDVDGLRERYGIESSASP